jgi:hypothetical protein
MLSCAKFIINLEFCNVSEFIYFTGSEFMAQL